MKTSSLLLLLLSILTLSCLPEHKEGKIDVYKNEILETEIAFAAMVKEIGMKEAFLYYAADEAVLLRNNQLYLGKESLANLFISNKSEKEISLVWEVEFVDVSSSGDLGYTYGEYLYTQIDKNGNITRDKGIFHTIWKRQSDEKWRFVWD